MEDLPVTPNLARLLHDLTPTLQPGEFVFCTVKDTQPPAGLEPLGTFREPEGLTLILPRAQADARGMSYTSIQSWITLGVYSSLEAVGLTAAVSRTLAAAGIPCNMVAAYHHDHCFIPVDEVEKALALLNWLAS